MTSPRKLTGREQKVLQEALADAFPERADLELLVQFTFGRSLDGITLASNLNAEIAALIRWANAQDQVEALVVGARQQNPGNHKLKEFEAARPDEPAPVSAPLSARAVWVDRRYLLAPVMVTAAALILWKASVGAPSRPERYDRTGLDPAHDAIPDRRDREATFFDARTFDAGSTPDVRSDAPHDGSDPIEARGNPWVPVGDTGFALQQHEVSWGEYLRVADAGSPPPLNLDLPVTGVTWDQARAYCQRFDRTDGSLPTVTLWRTALGGAASRRALIPAVVQGRHGDAGVRSVFGNAFADKTIAGHRDLVGNVREFVACGGDVRAPSRCAIGSSASQGDPAQFEREAWEVETLHAATTDPEIGFRCARPR